MSPKSNNYQETKNNLEWKLLTILRFITKESKVEVGKATERENRETNKEERMREMKEISRICYLALFGSQYTKPRYLVGFLCFSDGCDG